MKEYPKRIKKQLRELSGKAYENELKDELNSLYVKFEEWKKGDISSGELNEEIHFYHQNTARELFKKYNSRCDDVCVSRGYINNFLKREDIPDDVFKELMTMIDFFKNA